jgi:hypothetical protein
MALVLKLAVQWERQSALRCRLHSQQFLRKANNKNSFIISDVSPTVPTINHNLGFPGGGFGSVGGFQSG